MLISHNEGNGPYGGESRKKDLQRFARAKVIDSEEIVAAMDGLAGESARATLAHFTNS